MKKTIYSMLLTLVITNTSTYAWGEKGHALVAEVAFHFMDECTKHNVMQYLDGMTIEQAANWMDAIKKDHTNDYMKPYHYLDLEKGSKGIPSGDNIVSILTSTLKDLDHKQTMSKDEIKRHILLLFHLIGDIHQPLHIGYPSDKGGNTVHLSFLGGYGTNLHATWDSGIIEYKATTLNDILNAKKYTTQELEAVKKIDVIGWAKQSRGFLKNAYALQDDKVSENYIDADYAIIKTQLLDAGIRLAAVLEHYFKSNI